MDVTIQLLRNGPQTVTGHRHRSESLPYVRVAPGAHVRLGHDDRAVGRITETWWRGDALMARAAIDDRHEVEVHRAISTVRGASLEFASEGADLLPDVTDDGGSCMRYRHAQILGVAIGAQKPSRRDTVVVDPLPPEPEPDWIRLARSSRGLGGVLIG